MTAALPRQVELLWQQGVHARDPGERADGCCGDPVARVAARGRLGPRAVPVRGLGRERRDPRGGDGRGAGGAAARCADRARATRAAAPAPAPSTRPSPSPKRSSRRRACVSPASRSSRGRSAPPARPRPWRGSTRSSPNSATLLAALAGRFEVDEPIVTAGGSHFFDRVVVDARHDDAASTVRGSSSAAAATSCTTTASTATAPRARQASAMHPRSAPPSTSGRASSRAPSRGSPCSTPAAATSRSTRGSRSRSNVSRGDDRLDLEHAARIDALGDQHAFLRFERHVDIAPGDLVRLGISHPCTTFDRWDLMLVVDDDDAVVGTIRTDF